jgi:uncharacterized metal-binding protein
MPYLWRSENKEVMPSGFAHSSSTIILSGVVAGAMLALDYQPELVTSATIGVLAGLFIGPDWDVDGGNISDYHARKSLGVLPAAIFSFWKAPYAIALRHRSFTSHFPIISTLVRIAYIFFPILIVLFRNQNTKHGRIIFRSVLSQVLSIPFISLMYFLLPYAYPWGAYVIAGLILSDTLHFLMDTIF